MKQERTQRGPWGHRLLIFGFGVLLTVLLVWLLEFVVSDIGRWSGPEFEYIERKYVSQETLDNLEGLEKEMRALQVEIDDQKEIQGILRTSTENSRETMGQLVDIHKLNLEKDVKPTQVEQEALAESEARFLDNQKRFQEANEKIAGLSEQQRRVAQQIAALKEEIGEKRKPVKEAYDEAREVHLIKVAALKLAVIVPLLFVAAWFLLKHRTGPYAPIIYASFCATFWETGAVMFKHFPREYFKYIAIGAAIVIVLGALIHLIRLVTTPRAEWLIRQYKDAYHKRRCPVCAFPIQRGRFKDLLWTRRGPRGILPIAQAGEPDEDQAYTCPSCGQALYTACAQCGKMRHALLPYCQHCGAEADAPAAG